MDDSNLPIIIRDKRWNFVLDEKFSIYLPYAIFKERYKRITLRSIINDLSFGKFRVVYDNKYIFYSYVYNSDVENILIVNKGRILEALKNCRKMYNKRVDVNNILSYYE